MSEQLICPHMSRGEEIYRCPKQQCAAWSYRYPSKIKPYVAKARSGFIHEIEGFCSLSPQGRVEVYKTIQTRETPNGLSPARIIQEWTIKEGDELIHPNDNKEA